SGLHGGLGAPEDQRPGGPHGPVQGPVPQLRPARGPADRRARRPRAARCEHGPGTLITVAGATGRHVRDADSSLLPGGRLIIRRVLLTLLGGAHVVALGAWRPEQPDDPLAQIEVAGEVGRRPVVQVSTPVQVTDVVTEQLVTGDGTELADGDAVMLAYLAIDAATGEVVEDSYGRQPRILPLTEDEAGPLYDELVGRTEGSRLLRLEPGSMTRPDPVVLVYDILRTAAYGEELEVPSSLPQVERDEDGAPVVTLPEADPPTSL